jgi:hypothetical protein
MPQVFVYANSYNLIGDLIRVFDSSIPSYPNWDNLGYRCWDKISRLRRRYFKM